MSKDDFSVRLAAPIECKKLLQENHYLGQRGAKWKNGYNFALIKNSDVVGVCIFTAFPVPELVVGMFGLERKDQAGMYELSRLVVCPTVQECEHNIAGWFTAKCLNHLRKITTVRCVLSYADTGFHKGTVYRALGFDFYGETEAKKDFWFKLDNGEYKKHQRGAVKGLNGEWRPRTTKLRFVKIFDKTLKIKWQKVTK